MRRGPAVLLLLALLFGSAYGAWRIGNEGWNRVSSFAPAHYQAPRPTVGPPPLTNRLVLIMVDGLRVDDAMRLPSLDWLARRGAFYRLQVDGPAYQLPAEATILSGASPLQHGILLPQLAKPLGVDSLPAAARRLHVSTGGTGNADFATLAKSSLDIFYPAAGTVSLFEQAKPLLANTGPRLVIIQAEQLHLGSHQVGTANPSAPDYIELLGNLDASLEQVLDQLDLGTSTVVVTGTMPTATTGLHPAMGEVPLIVGGGGVKPGSSGVGRLEDIAPTAAALMGLPSPLQTDGRPLIDALTATGRPADVIAGRWLTTRKAFADAELAAYGAIAPAPDAPATLADADSYLQDLSGQIDQARFAYAKQELIAHLPYLGGAILAVLLILFLLFRQAIGSAAFFGAFTYGLVFHAVFYLTGGHYAVTMTGLEALGRPFVIGLLVKVTVAMAVASVVSGGMLSRKSFKTNAYLTVAALQMALATALLVALPVMVMLLFVPWDFPVQLPAPGLLIWFFLSAFQVAAIGVLGLFWVFITAQSVQLSRRIWPPKEPATSSNSSGKLLSMRHATRRRP
ncbi:MAG: hypothetical protein ACM3XM_20560 [Mycobacterium leprae]